MKEKQNKPNWAVEAVEPPSGATSFSTLHTHRSIRIQRRNPQFENESPAIASTGKRSESSAKSSHGPQKMQKGTDVKGDDIPVKRFSA